MGGSSAPDSGAAALAAQAQAAGEQAFQQYNDLVTPDINGMKLDLQGPQLVGLLNAEQVGDTALSGISTDPALRDAQMKALQALQERGVAGLTPEDMAALNQIKQQSEAQNQSQQSAIQQNLAERGLQSSGQELAARLSASQNSSNQAANAGLQIGAQSYAAKQNALAQAGQLSGQMQQADYAKAAQLAQAKDAIAQMNAANRQNVNAQNLASQQNISNQDIALSNQQQQYNKELQQQGYQNQFNLAAARANARTNQAQQALSLAESRKPIVGANTGGQIGTVLGGIGGAFAGGAPGAMAGASIGGVAGSALGGGPNVSYGFADGGMVGANTGISGNQKEVYGKYAQGGLTNTQMLGGAVIDQGDIQSSDVSDRVKELRKLPQYGDLPEEVITRAVIEEQKNKALQKQAAQQKQAQQSQAYAEGGIIEKLVGKYANNSTGDKFKRFNDDIPDHSKQFSATLHAEDGALSLGGGSVYGGSDPYSSSMLSGSLQSSLGGSPGTPSSNDVLYGSPNTDLSLSPGMMDAIADEDKKAKMMAMFKGLSGVLPSALGAGAAQQAPQSRGPVAPHLTQQQAQQLAIHRPTLHFAQGGVTPAIRLETHKQQVGSVQAHHPLVTGQPMESLPQQKLDVVHPVSYVSTKKPLLRYAEGGIVESKVGQFRDSPTGDTHFTTAGLPTDYSGVFSGYSPEEKEYIRRKAEFDFKKALPTQAVTDWKPSFATGGVLSNDVRAIQAQQLAAKEATELENLKRLAAGGNQQAQAMLEQKGMVAANAQKDLATSLARKGADVGTVGESVADIQLKKGIAQIAAEKAAQKAAPEVAAKIAPKAGISALEYFAKLGGKKALAGAIGGPIAAAAMSVPDAMASDDLGPQQGSLDSKVESGVPLSDEEKAQLIQQQRAARDAMATPNKNYKKGGIQDGDSYVGDRVDAKINSGEMVLNVAQQQRLFDLLRGKKDLQQLPKEDVVRPTDEDETNLHEKNKQLSARIAALEKLLTKK